MYSLLTHHTQSTALILLHSPLSLSYSSPLECGWASQRSLCPFQLQIVCVCLVKNVQRLDLLFFLTSCPGMLRGVWQERHQHEQAGGHLTGGKIPRLWHEDPAPHQGLRLCFRKGNWVERARRMFGSYVWEKCQKVITMIITFLHWCGTEGNGGTRRSDRFHSWKCSGLCLSNILRGFCDTWPKLTVWPARREKCGFLWEHARKTHLNRH